MFERQYFWIILILYNFKKIILFLHMLVMGSFSGFQRQLFHLRVTPDETLKKVSSRLHNLSIFGDWLLKLKSCSLSVFCIGLQAHPQISLMRFLNHVQHFIFEHQHLWINEKLSLKICTEAIVLCQENGYT